MTVMTEPVSEAHAGIHVELHLVMTLYVVVNIDVPKSRLCMYTRRGQKGGFVDDLYHIAVVCAGGFGDTPQILFPIHLFSGVSKEDQLMVVALH